MGRSHRGAVTKGTPIHFEDVHLDNHQRRLFLEIAEAFRSAERGRRAFFLSQTLTGDRLVHKGERNRMWTDLDKHDLDVMSEYGLLRATYGPRKGTASYNVTPQGTRYYKWLRQQQGEPVEQVETAMTEYIDSAWFAERFPEAYQRWSEAVEQLWSEDAPRQLAAIGYTTREAVQDFIHELARQSGVLDQFPDDKSKTVDRIRAVLDKRVASDTTTDFLEAQVVYFGTLSDLVQRLAHGREHEETIVTWEDARRVVFQSISVMYELARAVELRA